MNLVLNSVDTAFVVLFKLGRLSTIYAPLLFSFISLHMFLQFFVQAVHQVAILTVFLKSTGPHHIASRLQSTVKKMKFSVCQISLIEYKVFVASICQ